MGMKILPVNNTNFWIAKNQPANSKISLPHDFNERKGRSGVFYPPLAISFGCNSANPEFENELKSLHNVRCPVCNVKMLPYEDLQYIGIEIAQVEKPEDFVKVLNKHNESIPVYAKRLVEKAENLLKNMPEIETKDFVNMLSGEASRKIDSALIDGIVTLDDLQKNKCVSDSDNVLIDECKMRFEELIHNRDKRKIVPNVKRIMSETISNTQFPEKWQFYDSIKKEVIMRSNYKSLFKYENNETYKRLNVLLEKVFGNSEINLRKIEEKMPYIPDKNFNVIMLCKSCNFDKPALPSAVHHAGEEVNKNFSNYLSDISGEILNGNIETNKLYPMEVNGFLKKISKGKLDPFQDKNLIQELRRKNFKDFRVEVDFKPVSLNGMICACCGNKVLTHEEKVELMENIRTAKDLKSVVSVTKSADKYIHKKFKPLLLIAEQGVNDNATEREIMYNMKLHEQQKINAALEKSIEKLERILLPRNLPEYKTKHVEELKKLIKTKYYNYDFLKQFPYDEFKSDLKNAIKNLDQNDTARLVIIAKEPVRTAASEQLLVFPLNSTTHKLHSVLKCVMQDIVKRSTATIDHLQPKNKGGSNDLENLVVLCDDCNQRKTDYEFPTWLKLNPQMKENYKKYFYKIEESLALGKLKGYEEYLVKQRRYIKDLSGWVIDVNFNSDYAFSKDSTSRL